MNNLIQLKESPAQINRFHIVEHLGEMCVKQPLCIHIRGEMCVKQFDLHLYLELVAVKTVEITEYC